MTRTILVLTLLAGVLGYGGQSNAAPVPPGKAPGSGGAGPDPLFTFTFSDQAGDIGYGTLSAVDSGFGDGSLVVTSGTLALTSSSDPADVPTGTYSLVSGGPGLSLSPDKLFNHDNLIYPANNAASGANPGPMSGNPSYLTNNGLLFAAVGGTSEPELNLVGNGGDDYGFYAGLNGGTPISQDHGATFTLSAVPEPSSLVLLGIAGSTLAGYFGWRRRKLVAA